MAHACDIIIYHTIWAPGCGKVVAGVFNFGDKNDLSTLLYNDKLTGEIVFCNQIVVLISTQTVVVGISKEFKRYLSAA